MLHSWTDERLELLKKLWADGLPAVQIAVELGGVTRSAVLGKVHRLKLNKLPRLQRAPKQRQSIFAAEARAHGLKPATVYDRIRHQGMSREEALTTPVRGHHRAEEHAAA